MAKRNVDPEQTPGKKPEPEQSVTVRIHTSYRGAGLLWAAKGNLGECRELLAGAFAIAADIRNADLSRALADLYHMLASVDYCIDHHDDVERGVS